MESGECYNPPHPAVRSMMTECCTFVKSSGSATGATGVLMYDLYQKSHKIATERLAIMFSVPWDYNLYQNWFAVGVYKKDRNCDESLYKEMYYDKKQKERGFVREKAVGSEINYVGSFVDVKATMSSLENAIMKVDVWEKLFTPMGQQRY